MMPRLVPCPRCWPRVQGCAFCEKGRVHPLAATLFVLHSDKLSCWPPHKTSIPIEDQYELLDEIKDIVRKRVREHS